MKILFEEKQKFTQWWIWALLIGIMLIPIWGSYQQLFQGKPFGDHPLSDTGLIVFLILMILFMAFFWMIELRTQIDQEAIQVDFFPLIRRTFSWQDVESAEVIDYGFVGGWGIRLWTKYGTVYNIRGTMGLSLKLKNGKRYCIGTQQENELKRVITLIKQERQWSNR